MPLVPPELLAPAGSLKNMRYAFAYGADAVYAGQPRYSLRVRNNEFDHANLAIGIAEAQAIGTGRYTYSGFGVAPCRKAGERIDSNGEKDFEQQRLIFMDSNVALLAAHGPDFRP